ncbi:hypothetical protein C479_00210 [Halovivax asiaticus JCM 14624]|uniref:Uncharacterized protein n=1 Tax=Halovivax asiaticus JCM 14624 TaxID=1227490 RepID=M0BX78_9EURY|nr:hypothetical protein [Halovivax asiaticus]ELZ14284.1 hypothetical protein C479_00210 [Halovivax asiaticus JCM 14624]
MSLRARLWRLLRTRWKRDVRAQPDRYQVYVSFPTDERHSRTGPVAEHVTELEHLFEGWIDVYARSSGLAVVSDPVSADRFALPRFRDLLDRIEATYDPTHSLTSLEKWRTIDGALVKSFVVVPVKPLFPAAETESEPRRPAPAPAE